MKYILMTLALASAAAWSLAAPPAAAPPSDTALSKQIDDVEVVATDPVGKEITVKIKGEEETLPLPAKLTAAMRVVKPGDKVRIYYRHEDAEGRPKNVESLVITKPNLQQDKQSAPSDVDRAPQDNR